MVLSCGRQTRPSRDKRRLTILGSLGDSSSRLRWAALIHLILNQDGERLLWLGFLRLGSQSNPSCFVFPLSSARTTQHPPLLFLQRGKLLVEVEIEPTMDSRAVVRSVRERRYPWCIGTSRTSRTGAGASTSCYCYSLGASLSWPSTGMYDSESASLPHAAKHRRPSN